MHLPLEILVHIALQSVEAFCYMLAVPPVARYFKCHYKLVLSNFTRVEVKLTHTSYYFGNKLHRDDDLPAVEWTDGTKLWYRKGKLHRDSAPAVKYTNKTEYWYQNGELHRVGGPAVTYYSGRTTYWYQWGKLHREDGPAIDRIGGYRAWYIDDKLIRMEYIIMIDGRLYCQSYEK